MNLTRLAFICKATSILFILGLYEFSGPDSEIVSVYFSVIYPFTLTDGGTYRKKCRHAHLLFLGWRYPALHDSMETQNQHGSKFYFSLTSLIKNPLFPYLKKKCRYSENSHLAWLPIWTRLMLHCHTLIAWSALNRKFSFGILIISNSLRKLAQK